MKRQRRNCVICGKFFVPSKWARKGICCSARCRNTYISRTTLVKRAASQRYTGEGKSYVKYMGRHLHRVIAEKRLGRPLKKGEIVHHVDGNRRNNLPDNLIVTTQSEHARGHSTKNRKCSVDGCDGKHVALGYCCMHYNRHKKSLKKENTSEVQNLLPLIGGATPANV